MPINILHLSDLHLESPSSWDQGVLLKALEEDLVHLRHSQEAPSLVVFSGDLAKVASVPNAYDPVMNTLLSILEKLGLGEEHLITCPGNHDVNRTEIAPYLPDLERYRSEAATMSGANRLVDDPQFQAYARRAFGAYASLSDNFGALFRVHSDLFSSTYFYRDLGLAVVTLNTSTLCATGITPSMGDQDKLFVSEKSLLGALDKVPKGVPVVVVGHHPFSWLNQDSASLLERVLSQKANAYLSGHLHEAMPRQSQTFLGEFLSVQSGALYCGRPYWNGYGIVSLAPEAGHARIAYRRWYEPRRAFSKAEDLGDEGVFYSSKDAKTFWRGITPKLDMKVIERWRTTTLLPCVLLEANNTLAGSSLETHFVAPDFDFEVPFKSEGEGRIGSRYETVSLDTLIVSKTNYVISARSETGKSTLLKHIATAIARIPVGEPGWGIPVLLQFGVLRSYAQYVENLIRQKLPELPSGVLAGELIEQGYVTVIVDDVDFSQAERRDGLIAFVTSHPKCRFLFASSTTFVEVAALQPEIAPGVPFSKVRMRPFRRGQLITLVEKHGLTDPLLIDQMAERVIRDASSLNVPLTAVTGTFLIQIIQEEPDSKVINHAALIERYIEILLQKYAPRELLPGAFDFKNKVDLLCNLAEIMARTDEYAPEENDLLGWCISYLKAYGLRYSAADLVDYFVEARLFERHGSRIRFRLRMFFEFFCATRMIDDAEFKAYIFSEERHLEFINEIGFYSALNRRDHEQVERVALALKTLTNELWPEGSDLHDANKYLQNISLIKNDASEDELRELQDRLRSPKIIEQDRAILSESTEFEEESDSQTITRKRVTTPEERWVGHLLLLSSMVKHMELIPDPDKRRLLTETLDGWVRFTTNSMTIVAELAIRKKVVFNGITYRSALSENLSPGETARRMSLYMPAAVARMATIFLGTEKLQDQLEDGIGKSEEPAPRQFMRLAILSDLGVGGLSTLAEKVSWAVKGHRFLEHVFARKMYDIAVRYRLPKTELVRIRSLVGDIFVQINPAVKTKDTNRKNSVIAGMQQQRLQIGVDRKKEK